MSLAFVGIGANLGDPGAQVAVACTELEALPSTRVIARSSLYRSAPVGVGPQPEFVNAAAALDTGLDPHALLDALLEIETRHGRERPYPGAARTLDLDLLLHGTQELATPELTLPHPRLHERRFVLEPLAEIAPGLEIPGRGPVEALLARCREQQVERIA